MSDLKALVNRVVLSKLSCSFVLACSFYVRVQINTIRHAELCEPEGSGKNNKVGHHSTANQFKKLANN